MQVQIVSGFEFCPVVIRRHDVESFWTIPSSQRQQFFFDYLRDQGGAPLSTVVAARDVRRAEARDKLLRAKEKLQRAVHDDMRLPETYTQTKPFLNLLFKRYGERPRADGKKLPNRIYAPFVEYQQALEKTEKDPSLSFDEDEQLPQQQLREILDRVSLRVSDDFSRVVRKEWIREVAITLGDDESLDIRVALLSGRLADPVQVLNEAALDVLALLILLEVHIECAELGQEKLLVMDDVFQSVDAVHRVRSLEHALSRLRGWQLVLTMHDRLWVELARSAMQRAGVGSPQLIEVRAAREGGVPELRVGDSSPLEVLKRLIEDRASPEIQTSIAGRTLEQLCDRLSVSLGTSVTRRRDDKYTLGDLWPGVQKVLLKADISGLGDRVQPVGAFLALRNIAGAHYNAWAESVTHQEAEDFAQAVVGLWSHTICYSCSAPLSTFRAQ
ncbi:hypothetical protein [Terrabacter sp. Soil810]|uniref:hypothetical protein n=1 Tax=Terrabacter sp. Soil810 TaxID=1736418 RepID=UPI001F470ABA|nr:hypothetical protein [Terrabacter sp. Soil810]